MQNLTTVRTLFYRFQIGFVSKSFGRKKASGGVIEVLNGVSLFANYELCIC